MPWGRLDDKANGNAKLLALSDSAWRMWGCGLIYCQDNLTDGFIPEHAIHAFGVRARNKAAIAGELCARLVPGKGPLWHRVEGGFQIHDYLEWNDAREDVLAEREKSRIRQERFRNRGPSSNAKRNALQTPLVTLGGNALSTGVHVPLPQESKNPSDSVDSANHPVRDLLALHESLFLERFSQKPAKYTSRDAKIAKTVLERHGAHAPELLRRFMASNDDFIVKAGFGLNVFESQINKLLTTAGNGSKARSSAVPYHLAGCPHDPKCGTLRECSDMKAAARNGVPA